MAFDERIHTYSQRPVLLPSKCPLHFVLSEDFAGTPLIQANASSYQRAKTPIRLLKSPMSRTAGLATGGHAPSPYLRRFRLPNLGTIRPHDDPLSPESEYDKLELIRARMEEKNREIKQKQQEMQQKTKEKCTGQVEKAPFYHPENLFTTTQEKHKN